MFERRPTGHNQRGTRLCRHGGEWRDRKRGIRRDVGGAGLQHAQYRGHQGRALLQQHDDRRSARSLNADDRVGGPIRAAVQVGIAPLVDLVVDGDALGVAANLLRKALGDGLLDVALREGNEHGAFRVSYASDASYSS